MNSGFAWQRALAAIRIVLANKEGYLQIIYERGIITINSTRQSLHPNITHSDDPIDVEININQVFENVQAKVFQGRRIYHDDVHIMFFKEGEWVQILEKIASMIEEDHKDYLSPIDDNYLFPEYSGISVNLDAFPIVGGRNHKWREDRTGQLISWIHHVAYRKQFKDERIHLDVEYTKAGHISGALLLIRPPIVVPTWRPVFAIDLRGGQLFIDRFRPGKWLFYLQHLVSKE